jgi:hypothetical protein
MDDRTRALIEECKRQAESCLWTSATYYEWLKCLRFWRAVFVVAPIVLGGFAGWQVLTKAEEYQWLTGLCALLAGMFPAIYKALDFDTNLDVVAKDAAEFKVLEDRFRQCWQITAQDGFDPFKAEFSRLMDRMDAVREGSLAAPDRYFEKARKKIAAGHYDFAVDAAKSPSNTAA